MTVKIEDVLELVEHGLRVVPLHSPGKRPRIKNWPKIASSDENKVRELWSKHPDSNVGVVTGRKSSVVVLDVDPRAGGDDELAALEEDHGRLPHTVESLTGGGGRHLFFQTGRFVSNSTLAPGLDLKGENGLVVAPPSLHKSGRLYEWESSSMLGKVIMQPPPDWLLVQHRGNRTRVADHPLVPGHRNTALARRAGFLKMQGFNFETIKTALLEENRRACQPPLPEREIQAMMGQVAKWDEAPPWLSHPWSFFDDPRLSQRGHHILRVLTDYAGPDGRGRVGYRKIAERTQINKKHVRAALDELEAAGRIEDVWGSKDGTHYRIVFEWASTLNPGSTVSPRGYT